MNAGERGSEICNRMEPDVLELVEAWRDLDFPGVRDLGRQALPTLAGLSSIPDHF